MNPHTRHRARRGRGGLAVLVVLAMAVVAGGGALAQDSTGDPTCPSEVPPADFTDRDAIATAHLCAVDEMAARDILEGYPDLEFKPTAPVTRGHLASLVYRVLLATEVTLPEAGQERFADVPPGSAHDEAIHRLAAAGIVHGGPFTAGAEVFGRQLVVRRDQLASMLGRAHGYAAFDDPAYYEGWPEDAPADQTVGHGFADVPPTNVHHGNVSGANHRGLVLGFDDGLYRPRANLRRDQLATSGVRLLFILESGSEIGSESGPEA